MGTWCREVKMKQRINKNQKRKVRDFFGKAAMFCTEEK
jgi:hypothetical protein